MRGLECVSYMESRECGGNTGGFRQERRGALIWLHREVASELIHSGGVRVCLEKMIEGPSRKNNISQAWRPEIREKRNSVVENVEAN